MTHASGVLSCWSWSYHRQVQVVPSHSPRHLKLYTKESKHRYLKLTARAYLSAESASYSAGIGVPSQKHQQFERNLNCQIALEVLILTANAPCQQRRCNRQRSQGSVHRPRLAARHCFRSVGELSFSSCLWICVECNSIGTLLCLNGCRGMV